MRIPAVLSKNPGFFEKETGIPSWVLALLAAVLLLRIPFLFEPYWYGDEMIYLTLGQALRRGLVFYRDIYDNKPPLLYLMAAISENLSVFKALLTVWNLATIAVFYKLAAHLFYSRKTLVKVSVVTFALLTTLPLLEGNIVNAELFMILPTIFAFWVLLSKTPSPKNIFLSGVLASTSILFKVPALFDLGAIVFLWLVAVDKFKETSVFAKKLLILTLGVFTPIAATLVYFTLLGAANQYLAAAFLQNIGYLSSFRPGDQDLSFLQRNLPLLARLAIVGVILTILFLKRKTIPKNLSFVTSWFAFSLFAATLSERPYPHYLIQVVPSLSLFVGLFVEGVGKERSFSLVPLSLLALALVFFKFYYFPVFSYYKNFIDFAIGSKSKWQYFSYFDKSLENLYETANFVAQYSSKEDTIFVWGDNPAVYTLSRRLPPQKYTVSYHIIDFKGERETLDKIIEKKPKYIIWTQKSKPLGPLYDYARDNYLTIASFGDFEIWKILTPKMLKLLAPGAGLRYNLR